LSTDSTAADRSDRDELRGASEDGKNTALELPVQFQEHLRTIETYGWHDAPIVWKEGYSLLHWAAQKNKAALCEHLVELGADPFALDASGWSAVDFAKEFHSTEALDVLQRSMSLLSPKLLEEQH